MSASTGIALMVGGITAANEALFAPLAENKPLLHNFNWRIIPATGIFALALTGADQISPVLGKGIGVIALVTVLFTSFGNAGAPASNLAKVMGYTK